MFHTLCVLLCSPLDPLKPDPGWIQSAAYVKCQEHTLRTTTWLKLLLQSDTETPDFATGVGTRVIGWR